MEKLIDINGLSEVIGRSVGSIRNDLSSGEEGRLPKSIRIGRNGRLLRWRPQDITAWIDAFVDEKNMTKNKQKRGRPTKTEQIRRERSRL